MKENSPAVIGKKIIKELNKKGVLLLQDKTFPSVVSTIVGEPIIGSWWGHPMANPIYNGLNWAIDQKSIISAKLLSKKVTYINKKLYPFFFSIVSEVRPWQLKGLSKESTELMAMIKKSKTGIRSDSPEFKLKYPALKKHIDDLETRLLIYTEEIHTEGGKHAKEIKPWAKSVLFTGKLSSYEVALEEFNFIVLKLNKKSNSKIKLPWPSK